MRQGVRRLLYVLMMVGAVYAWRHPEWWDLDTPEPEWGIRQHTVSRDENGMRWERWAIPNFVPESWIQEKS